MSKEEEDQDMTNLQVRYSTNHILRYEFIWGKGWVSPGGESTSRDLCRGIESALKSARVLDIGSGTGGAAFMMAKEFDPECVVGVDIAQPMVDLCTSRMEGELKDKVKFIAADIMAPPSGVVELKPSTFDVIWSRDSFLHIPDKKALLKTCLNQLKPGGTILFTDYCMAAKPVKECSQDFQEYLAGRGYELCDVDAYGQTMEAAGFQNVLAEDRTTFFLDCLKSELEMLQSNKEKFLEEFTQNDYEELEAGWKSKIKWCTEGDMHWGVFKGKRDYLYF